MLWVKTISLATRLFLGSAQQHAAKKETLTDVDASAVFDEFAHCLLLVAEELARRT
jgi:hypothetical protein